MIACAALALGAPLAMAQDKPAPAPSKDPPTNDTQELLKRIRAEAEKQGLRVDQPQPTPAPVVTPVPAGVKTPPPVAPAPTPAVQPGSGAPTIIKPPPATFKTPQPGPTKVATPVPPPQPTPGARPPAIAPNPNAPVGSAALGNSAALNSDEFLINFTDYVELTALVEFIRTELDLQILFMDGQLKGQTVYLSAPITIKKKDVLGFITMLLEQRQYTLRQDSTGIFIVEPKQEISMTSTQASLPWGTTRIIRTPNIKPTSLQNSITAMVTAGRAGQPGVQPVYMDDLGIIIMTETPRVLNLIEDFVKTLVTERASMKFYRFELLNISAAAARDRVLELLGQQTQRTGGGVAQGNPILAGGGGAIGPGGSITNLSERLTIDPTSNALFLRGRDEEKALLTDMLTVVDLPNGMLSKWYPVGNKAAIAVATQGKAEQLGNVSEFNYESAGRSGNSGGAAGGLRLGAGGGNNLGAGNNADTASAGAGFVLYPDAGGFIFRGTPAQHARVVDLVEALKVISIDEYPTYEFYKLRHGKAVDIAQIIQNLLSNSGGTGNTSGGLLGRDLGGRSSGSTNRRNPAAASGSRAGANPARPAGDAGSSGGSGGLGEIDGADVFVLADEPNNQVLVKAPAKLQPQFRHLIGKIDLRRSQVYIDCKIITVSESDSFRLAIEAQQIIGQFAFNTNFGLGSLTSTTGTGTGATTTGGLQSRKAPATGLGGLTAALIRSKDVPLVINALASDIHSRIVATPQLLVDDNEEAEISSLDQQPTGTTSVTTGNPQVTSFGDYQSAGPRLTVKPQISEGGYLRLEYDIELSAFQGSGSGNLPPPKIENKIKSKVMVPTDATIVVGGLTFQQTGTTVVKVPLLGDIPLLGHLFRDTSETNRLSTLYVFITPKIMRDATFADLRLLTRAPLAEAGLPLEYPAPKPESIPVVDSARYIQEEELRKERDSHKEKPEISPAKGAPVRKEPPVRDEPQ